MGNIVVEFLNKHICVFLPQGTDTGEFLIVRYNINRIIGI